MQAAEGQVRHYEERQRDEDRLKKLEQKRLWLVFYLFYSSKCFFDVGLLQLWYICHAFH